MICRGTRSLRLPEAKAGDCKGYAAYSLLSLRPRGHLSVMKNAKIYRLFLLPNTACVVLNLWTSILKLVMEPARRKSKMD